MFIDKADIKIRAGKGGNGAVSFHREKYVTAGGPDGGDGGRGGNIVLQTDRNMSTLMDFRYKRKYTAENGSDGKARQMTGKSGADMIIKVPDGTVIRDTETGAVIKDMSGVDTYIAARGGNGGWGNKRFATPTRQAPRFARPGMPGETRDITLELKLIADVGLVGFPNVGKSTLLAAVTKARPKIADYHFTTLYPNLGLVYVDEGESFVIADIPGLIEGASGGAGLGHEFLRHVERCRLIIHVVDIAGIEGRNPCDDFNKITAELAAYNPELAELPVLVAANKTDIAENPEITNEFTEFIKQKNLPLYMISAATGDGVRDLIYAAARELRALPPVRVFETEYLAPEPESNLNADSLKIERQGGVWIIEGTWLDRILEGIDFGEYEQRMYFNRLLERTGVNNRLETLGVAEGDTVIAGGFEFEYAE